MGDVEILLDRNGVTLKLARCRVNLGKYDTAPMPATVRISREAADELRDGLMQITGVAPPRPPVPLAPRRRSALDLVRAALRRD